jgi:dTDP-4-dehydrorhamnose reductase
MAPRLLIIGATGFVGSRLARAADASCEVFRSARHASGDERSVAIDITDPQSVRAVFNQVRPRAVIHLAALSDIDRCERERDLADLVNHTGAVHVAQECLRTGARLLCTSTDAVFDGTKGLYREHDPPSPPNWYGETKALAEAAIGRLLPDAAIVRLSLVLGRSEAPGGNSYLDKVLGNLAAGNTIAAATFEYRNPIDVGTLAQFLLEIVSQPTAAGIFHVGASDKMSRYELTRAIAEHLGYDPQLIVRQESPPPGRAPRGADDFLATDRVRHMCRTSVPTCQEVVERAVRSQ